MHVRTSFVRLESSGLSSNAMSVALREYLKSVAEWMGLVLTRSVPLRKYLTTSSIYVFSVPHMFLVYRDLFLGGR
jgi:hypothetical protein